MPLLLQNFAHHRKHKEDKGFPDENFAIPPKNRLQKHPGAKIPFLPRIIPYFLFYIVNNAPCQ
jgi:hypothetical protein